MSKLKNAFGEQTSPNGYIINYSPGMKKWYKKLRNKKIRKQAKQNPEEAARKYGYKGWAD